MIRRVGAAFLAVDGFTGIPLVDAGVRIQSEDGAVPVRKAEGYYVFWDNGEKNRRFLIEAPGFYPESLLVDTEALKQRSLAAKSVYLIPSPDYPFPAGMGWIKEQGKPGETAVFPWKGTEHILSVRPGGMSGISPGETAIKAPRGFHMRDRILYLKSGPDSETEQWVVADAGNREGLYLLERQEKLEGLFRPEIPAPGTRILLAYRTRGDSMGRYLIPDMTSLL